MNYICKLFNEKNELTLLLGWSIAILSGFFLLGIGCYLYKKIKKCKELTPISSVDSFDISQCEEQTQMFLL